MKKLTLPLTISLALIIVFVLIKLFRPDLVNMEGEIKYLVAALLVGLSIVVVRAISYVLFDVVFMKRKGREASELLRGVLAIILYSVCFILIYKVVLKGELGLGVVATSTVVSVIIGLALQDTLGNFFAGISIHIEQPFHILDAIKIGSEIGKVEAVTWRTTTIRTNNNTVVIFPNSKVAREQVEVFPFNNLNRRVIRFPAPYGLPPETVIPLVREAVRALPNVAPEKTPIVRIAEFHDSSINYEVLYWVRDYMLTPDMDAKIRELVWYVYSRNRIEIPFPIRHVLLEQQAAHATQSENYEGVIAAVGLFEPLSTEERETIARALVKYVYAPGEVILRRGDPGDSMFIIRRGQVDVRLPGSNGDMQHLAMLGRGDFFGEMALMTGEPRAADIYAMGEVEVLEIRKPVMQDLLNANAQLAEALSQKLARRQAELVAHTRAVPEEEKKMQTETILRRIQRFFSLS